MPTSKVYTPITKQARRLGTPLTGKSGRILTKRPQPPGMHGAKRHGRPSGYGIQLLEKQKARLTYGLREKQFRRLFKEALKTKGATGYRFLQLLETRLDNVLFRAGLAPTRRSARQLIGHGHIKINGRKLDIPSYQTKTKDQIEFFNPDKINSIQTDVPAWLKTDKKNKSVTVLHLPKRDEITTDINEQLVVEFYSR